MTLEKKRVPHVNSDSHSLNMFAQKIYDDINDLIESVNQGVLSETSPNAGKAGDIRLITVIKDNKKVKQVHFRFNEGWFKPVVEDGEIKFELIEERVEI